MPGGDDAMVHEACITRVTIRNSGARGRISNRHALQRGDFELAIYSGSAGK